MLMHTLENITMKSTFKNIFISVISGFAGAYLFFIILPSSSTDYPQKMVFNTSHRDNVVENRHQVSTYAKKNLANFGSVSFVEASDKSTASVVFIKSVSGNDTGRSSWWDWYFDGGSSGQATSSGSGVIYTQNGYIVTNNHVIENATTIEIIHKKRAYTATLVGTDPSTDLAVLKIEAQNLPAIALGSSKSLAVGEWVLAVGNPFNLASTVTAGIVSAKGREINILKSKFPIESFIQTDAAINPGNSGGALVNTRGELVGINTAILSRNGSYAGYGFAVPVDIVRKVVDDLIRYGEVQKAFFGAEMLDIDPEVAAKLRLEDLSGVAINFIQKEGAAEKIGLKRGDVILAINGQEINSRSGFDETISYYSPGDKIKVAFNSDGKFYQKDLVLTNREGTTEILVREIFTSNFLGANLETVSKVERNLINIHSGVKVTDIKDGLMRRLRIKEGYIITAINNYPISSPETLSDILTKAKGKVVIEFVNSEGRKGYYSYYF